MQSNSNANAKNKIKLIYINTELDRYVDYSEKNIFFIITAPNSNLRKVSK